MTTNCVCCRTTDYENGVWAFFSLLMGFRHVPNSLKNPLLYWWNQTTELALVDLFSDPFLSLFIGTCGRKDVLQKWGQLCAKVDLCIHEIRITRVYLFRLPPGLVKLNTNGSALGNPGELLQEAYLGIAMEASYMLLLVLWESGLTIRLSLKRLREGNAVSDALSKHSHTTLAATHFTWIHDLPIHIRGLLRTDKLGLANLRRKKTKRIKEPP
ncbi:hypothetical protein H5410_027620 [Solanum commersonii]|uniref:Uncharacterized protein n=1 Tax=Solanum commersonii TaxID=4109 RepID=A0A9J5Z2F0_SOLCO|nr:hypothetical protein H5410_027620 [Solanum commersonii]